MKHALIKEGRVVEIFEDVIELEFPGTPSAEDPSPMPVVRGVTLAERFHADFVAQLEHYDPSNLPHPPETGAEPVPVPSAVTKRQGRLALVSAGKLAAVDEAIAELPSPQREAAEIEWNDATNYVRASPFVALLGEAIGFDDDALDALFIQAASL